MVESIRRSLDRETENNINILLLLVSCDGIDVTLFGSTFS